MKKLLSVFTALAVAVALLTGSIAVPTLMRPLYYAHITPLHLPERSGMTQEEIVRAYDEVLDYRLFTASVIILAAVLVYSRKHRLHRFLNRGPAFWGASSLTAVLLTVGTLATANFDRAFEVFHTLFFPGKDNWVLYANVDPIIRIMPVEYFRECALVVLGLILAETVVITAIDVKNSA